MTAWYNFRVLKYNLEYFNKVIWYWKTKFSKSSSSSYHHQCQFQRGSFFSRLFSFSLSLNLFLLILSVYVNNICACVCVSWKWNDVQCSFMCVTYKPLHKIYNFITHKINFIRISTFICMRGEKRPTTQCIHWQIL